MRNNHRFRSARSRDFCSAPSMFAQGPAIAVIATSMTSVTPTSVYVSGQATGNTTIEGNIRVVYGLKAHDNYWQWDNWAMIPVKVTADVSRGSHAPSARRISRSHTGHPVFLPGDRRSRKIRFRSRPSQRPWLALR